MSGGGGGGYYIPPVRTKVTVSCERLIVVTTLMHPNGELLATLAVGDVLTVHSVAGEVTAQYGEEIVGVVEAPEKSRIIECMKAGTIYVADIILIEGTICKVRIHALQL